MWNKVVKAAGKWKTLSRVCAFILVFALIISALTEMFQPVWFEWNNYHTIHGFYKEPDNTIETIFLGASVMAGGINPAQLYQDYGICAYNLGTVHQPLISSYYWMEEAYRLHPKTLKTVVLDVSLLREGTTDAFFHKSIDDMQFSGVKVRMALDYADGSITEPLNYLVPFISYHTRWNELTVSDFEKDSYEIVNGTRGYHFQTRINLKENSGDQFDFSNAVVRKTKLIEDAKALDLYDDALGFLDRMYNFCQKRGINLVLVKTPTLNWASGWHHAVQEIADQYGLPFLDFRYTPLIDELDLIFELETTDNRHLNHYGATKFTEWIGEYLVRECNATDVRGNERYAFMEDQMELYRENVLDPLELSSQETVEDYLECIMQKDYTVFLTVRDEASSALTDEQRARFADMGLTKLATIGFRDSYLAVIDNGSVVVEELRSAVGLPAGTEAMVYEDVMRNGLSYRLKSGAFGSGMTSSCVIDGTEYTLAGRRGVNVVVWDNVNGEVINRTSFDTSESAYRNVYTLDILKDVRAAASADTFEEGSLRYNLWNYLHRIDLSKRIEEQNKTVDPNDLFGYLTRHQQDPDNVIFISSKGEASRKMNDTVRTILTYSGLPVLASLNAGDCYVGCVYGDGTTSESIADSFGSVYQEYGPIEVISHGANAGDESSVLVDGIEYSPNEIGLNIVVYNQAAGSVVGWYTFDTGSIEVTVPDEGY